MSDRKLNAKQQRILKLAYKFRYLTTKELSDYLHVSPTSSYKSLETLTGYGLLAKYHKSTFRLQNKSARYYLLPKSFPFLESLLKTNPSVLHSYYANKRVSEDFIDKQIDVFRIFNKFVELYGTHYSIYTQYELIGSNTAPEQTPQLYLSSINSNNYYVYLLDTMALNKFKSLLAETLDFIEDQNTDTSLLLITRNNRFEKSLLRESFILLDNRGDETLVKTVSLQTFLDADSKEIYTLANSEQPSEPVKL